jgi:hypothetical protein
VGHNMLALGNLRVTYSLACSTAAPKTMERAPKKLKWLI